MEIGKFKVLFESGESRGCGWILNPQDIPNGLKHLPYVNYMLCKTLSGEGDKIELYAEYYITGSGDDWDCDEGYDALKTAIIESAMFYGVPRSKLKFFYDDD